MYKKSGFLTSIITCLTALTMLSACNSGSSNTSNNSGNTITNSSEANIQPSESNLNETTNSTPKTIHSNLLSNINTTKSSLIYYATSNGDLYINNQLVSNVGSNINALSIDREGNCFIGDSNGNLWEFDGDNMYVVTHILDNYTRILSVAASQTSNDVYFSIGSNDLNVDKTLWDYNTLSKSLKLIPNSPDGSYTKTMQVDSINNLYIGTNNGNVYDYTYLMNKGEWGWNYVGGESPNGSPITSLKFNESGVLFVGTQNGNLFNYIYRNNTRSIGWNKIGSPTSDNSTITSLDYTPGTNLPVISTINGNVYVYLGNSNWHKVGPTKTSLTTIAIDPISNEILAGDNSSILTYTESAGTWTNMYTGDDYSINSIKSYGSGNIIYSTRRNIWNNNTLLGRALPDADNFINAMTIDMLTGNIYYGDNFGNIFGYVGPGNFIDYNSRYKTKDSTISAIDFDQSNNSTDLYYADNLGNLTDCQNVGIVGTSTVCNILGKSIDGSNILTITHDSNHNLLVGTETGNVYQIVKVDGVTNFIPLTNSPLDNSSILSIASVSPNLLYIGTNKGNVYMDSIDNTSNNNWAQVGNKAIDGTKVNALEVNPNGILFASTANGNAYSYTFNDLNFTYSWKQLGAGSVDITDNFGVNAITFDNSGSLYAATTRVSKYTPNSGLWSSKYNVSNQSSIINVIAVNPMIEFSGLNIKLTESVDYQNFLTGTPVGQFGLANYTITNNSGDTITNMQFMPDLSGEFTYDDTRTTCYFNNTKQLQPNASCEIVIKYQPTHYNESGTINLLVKGETNQGFVYQSANAISIPYTSCGRGQNNGC